MEFSLLKSIEEIKALTGKENKEDRIVVAVLEKGFIDIELNLEYNKNDLLEPIYYCCIKYGYDKDDWESYDYIYEDVKDFSTKEELMNNMNIALDNYIKINKFDITKPIEIKANGCWIQ